MSPIHHSIRVFQKLSECQAEQVCQIKSLTGDLNTKLRLVNLGFHTDSYIKILFIRDHNFVICIDGTRFALDASLAQHIEVGLLS